MRLKDFNFELPQSLIAPHPLPSRSESRLMFVDSDKARVEHYRFHHLIDLLRPDDLLIFNDTKVIPARLLGKKVTGGQVEILVERILDDQRMLAQMKVSKPPRIGDHLIFSADIHLTVVNKHHQFYELCYEKNDKTILEIVEQIGHIPLPHYMQRLPEEKDCERYQTVYAKNKGAVAAPTAGFHFDEELLKKLQDKQIDFGFLTLHIGSGTFTPVRVENIHEHKMHAERLEISQELSHKISQAKAQGRRIVAVGTTSLRALETASQSGKIEPYHGETNIFIYPGYQFHCVDVLITNFHLPCSTLLMLVCAFGGYENVMQAYQLATQNAYRFYSYGDAMLITRSANNDNLKIGMGI